MDWITEHVWWLLGMLAVYIVGAESRVLWEHIRPKSLRYTPKGLILAAAAAATLWAVWTLMGIILGDEPITSVIASIFLVSMGSITLVAAAAFLMIKRVHWRLRVIEKHCGLPVME